MYVCNVCMYVRMYVCTYVRMYVCTYVRMYVCTYVRMYVCTYVRMYVCTYVRLWVMDLEVWLNGRLLSATATSITMRMGIYLKISFLPFSI